LVIKKAAVYREAADYGMGSRKKPWGSEKAHDKQRRKRRIIASWCGRKRRGGKKRKD